MQHLASQDRPQSRSLRRWSTVLGATALALTLGAGTAMAHVTVSPGEVAPGSYTKLTFRVPNESETASTTKVVISIPADTPFASVRAKQTPGWTIELTESDLPAPVTQGTVTLTKVITSVAFTAQTGNEIGPGQFGEFDLNVGRVPDAPQIVFKAEQTYSDGNVVNWDQVQAPGAAEPDHPAPVLQVTGPPSDGHGHGGATVEASTDHDEGSNTALIFGIAGTVLGFLGLGFGLAALRRPKKAA